MKKKEFLKEGDLEDFQSYFLSLKGCCLGTDTEKAVEDSVELIAFAYGAREDRGAAITKLKNGHYAIFEEWQDYTGHGCQCDCWSAEEETIEEAVRMGLTDQGRARLLGSKSLDYYREDY